MRQSVHQSVHSFHRTRVIISKTSSEQEHEEEQQATVYGSILTLTLASSDGLLLVKWWNSHSIRRSSHDAIVATLSLTAGPRKAEQKNKELFPKIKWSKVDMERYKHLTGIELRKILDNVTSETDNELLLRDINSVLRKVAIQCDPTSRTKTRRKTRLRWASILKPLVAKVKAANRAWKKAGRPMEKSHKLFIARKAARLNLRRAQRQLTADSRNQLHSEIMHASKHNQQSMFKLIRKQRAGSQSTKATTVIFKPPSDQSEIDGWADYFEDLATFKHHPSFCQEALNSATVIHALLSTLSVKAGAFPPITEQETERLINSMRKGKAADPEGLNAEHVIYASEEIIAIVTLLINNIFQQGKIPDSMKKGLVTPILKKGKPASNPDSYRRITVTSLLGKVLEKELLKRTRAITDPFQSKHQFGFTSGCSSVYAVFLLTECIAEAKDLKSPLYITFLDASKAFDIVCHKSMLNSAFSQGVDGQLWELFNSMYSAVTSEIKWLGGVSRPIIEELGIRQGAYTSPDMFKLRSNPLLNKLVTHPGAFHIGSIPVGAVMCADDLAVITSNSSAMQQLLTITEIDAANERYLFSSTKTKAVTPKTALGYPYPELFFKLNGNPLEQSDDEIHLGVHRTTDTRSLLTVSSRIQTARRTAYSLMGAVMHGLNGINPKTSRKIWDIYVIPVLLHGLEALILSKTETQLLEDYYRGSMKQIQHLPASTANAATYLLLGIIPIEGQLHKRILTLFINMVRRRDSIEAQVIRRQLAVKDSGSHSSVIMARQLLSQYQLPSAFQLVKTQPSKYMWKNLLKQSVNAYWRDHLISEATSKVTLSFINLNSCTMNRCHPIWELTNTDTLTVLKAAVKAKLITQRYNLFGGSTRDRSQSTICPMCKSAPETITHFILLCPSLEGVRVTYLRRIDDILQTADVPRLCELTEEDATRLILDSSHFIPLNNPLRILLEQISLDLCFKLHHTRSLKLSGISGYTVQRRGKTQKTTNNKRHTCGD